MHNSKIIFRGFDILNEIFGLSVKQNFFDILEFQEAVSWFGPQKICGKISKKHVFEIPFILIIHSIFVQKTFENVIMIPTILSKVYVDSRVIYAKVTWVSMLSFNAKFQCSLL